MAYIITYLYSALKKCFEEHKDPRVEHYPLMSSMTPMTIIISIYLAFVLYYGPKWMGKRKPYNLKYIIRCYNAIQVIANFSILLYGIPKTILEKNYSLTCQPIDTKNTERWMISVLDATYGYYLTKYLDLFDTIFFVLRKKNKQITFLHVYHHAGMVFACHIFFRFLAGSHSTMLGVVNLFVHTVMYSYYFMTSLRPVKQSLWWKRHITQLQLLQFGYLIIHFLQVIIYNPCHHPPLVSFVGLIQNLFMFVMFFDFYYKTYIKQRAIKTTTTTTTTTDDEQRAMDNTETTTHKTTESYKRKEYTQINGTKLSKNL